MRNIQRQLVLGLMIAFVVGFSVGLPSAPAQSQAYSARGQEPGWSMTIGDTTITLTTMAGQRFEAAKPARGQIPQGYRYGVVFDGKPVEIVIEARLCRDTMSGMPHPDSVTISGLAAPLKGCGGSPHALLGPGEWAISELDASPVLAGTSPTLEFAGESVFGNASCNRFRGGFKLTGEGMRIEQLATTMMACPPDVMGQEHAVVRKLEATQRFDIRADGALILYDGANKTLIAIRKPKSAG